MSGSNVAGVLADGILFTDHYQLTMAQVYLRMGLHERRAQFDHTFRAYPDYGTHQSGYCINAGLAPLLDWMDRVRFGPQELEALRSFRSEHGSRVFGEDFLAYLDEVGGFGEVTMWAVPEGRVVHPDTPITVVEAPLPIAQILETPLLNHRNYETLVATKASRVAEAAAGSTILEFGLRRAPALGGNAATRASLIGGADFSSNVGMSLDLGYPSKGTHAHSMVQVFMAVAGGELEAFRAYAETYPDDCLLLVDTIDTLESGIPNAIAVFDELARAGHRPVGIRLDSGDLAYLAVQAARMLDVAGYPDTRIVLSSALDEITIWQIRNQIAEEAPRYDVDADRLMRRLVYGVGSKMVTSHGDPALDGVYKVVAVERDGGWVPAIKISDSPAKTVNPGSKELWRVYDARGRATADLIALRGEPVGVGPLELRHPSLPEVSRRLAAGAVSEVEPLLVRVLDRGRRAASGDDVEAARSRRANDLGRLDPGVRRLVNPHTYHVSLTPGLWELKQSLLHRLAG